MLDTTTWMNVQINLWSEKSHFKKITSCITPWKWQNYRNEKQIHGCQGLRRKYGYKRTRGEPLVVMEMFGVLTVSVAVAWYHTVLY